MAAESPSWRSPVYPAGSIHGPKYDKKGHRVPSPEPAIVGWLTASGVYERLAPRPSPEPILRVGRSVAAGIIPKVA